MKFITVHTHRGESIVINAEEIESLRTDRGYSYTDTVIKMRTGDIHRCAEGLSDVQKLIDA